MAITLQVSSHQAPHMGADARKVLENGGTLGRLASNDMVLTDPDRIVSGTHAVISRRGEGYVIADRSTNGTLLNGVVMPRGGEQALGDGDVIGIGPYQVTVSIGAAGDRAGRDAPIGMMSRPLGADEDVDPLNLLDRKDASDPEWGSPQRDDAPAGHEHFTPPRMVPDPPQASGGNQIPDNWWEADSDPGAAEPPPPKPPVETPDPSGFNEPPLPGPAAPPPDPKPLEQPQPEVQSKPADPHAGGVDEALDRLLRGAGIDPTQVNRDVLGSLGEVLRVVVQGMVEVLHARAEIKNEFRVPVTMLQAVDNNPLKLAVDAEDALFNLFVKSSRAYKDPVDAFREGFDDIKNHQVAMLVGMRAAFASTLAQFDPDRLEKAFDQGLKRSRLLDVVNKTKYWELYRETYEQLGDDEQAFRRLFGDHFAQAYEREMQRLTSSRRAGPST